MSQGLNSSQHYLSTSAEFNLILACLTAPWRKEMRENAQHILKNNSLDWKLFQLMVSTCQASLLVYETLKGLELPPEATKVMEKAGEFYYFNSKRNITMTSQFLKIHGLFQKAGVYSIPYKGPVFAVDLYKDLNLRGFADLDFFIPKEDIPKAVQILQDNGFDFYEPTKPEDLDKALESRWEYVVNMVQPEEGLMLELHWNIMRLANLPSLGDGLFWKWAKTAHRFGVEVNMFPPEEMYFILILHNAKHRWKSLRHLVDMTRILEKYPDFNWARIHELAKLFECEEEVDTNQRALVDLLSYPVPSQSWTSKHRKRYQAEKVAFIRAMIMRNPQSLPSFGEWRECLRHVEGGFSCSLKRDVMAYLRALWYHEEEDTQRRYSRFKDHRILNLLVCFGRYIKYYTYGQFQETDPAYPLGKGRR